MHDESTTNNDDALAAAVERCNRAQRTYVESRPSMMSGELSMYEWSEICSERRAALSALNVATGFPA